MNARLFIIFGLGIALMPVIIAAMLQDFATASTGKRFLILTSVLALGATLYLGIPDAASDWLYADSHATYLVAAVGLVGAILLVGTIALNRYAFASLRWPRHLSHFAFKERCVNYLLRAGWKVTKRKHDDELEIAKDASKTTVFCHFDLLTYDIVTRIRRSSGKIILTGKIVDDTLVLEAAALGIRMTHYKSLDRLDEVLCSPLPQPPAPMDQGNPDDSWQKLRALR